MIDIHTHILPGIDDGAQTEEEAIEMAKKAYKNGIRTLIATPHHMNRTYMNEKTNIEAHVRILNELFQSQLIPLQILPGQELRIYGQVIDDLRAGKIQTLNNSKYLLIEFPTSEVPNYTEQLFFDLLREGIIPIIAHPERNRELIRNPEILYELVKKGALAQLTSGSLTGVFGKEIEKVAHEFLSRHLIHFIATDAHNIDTRTFDLDEAYSCVEKEHGSELVYLLKENSNLVINNLNVNKQEPARAMKRRRFLGLF